MYQTIIIGCGFAGAVVARELAERNKEKILLIDQRDHVGGNCYDKYDEYGIMIHQYGPHIFHTNNERVYKYLSRFTKWYDYRHEVVGNIYGKEMPIPFNLNTLELVYGKEKAAKLETLLVERFGEGARVPILELMNSDDEKLKEIADYVYENIFLKYTMKQWGKSPKEIDPAVSGRVPVLVSRDNRYFQDKYQGMPLEGYTKIFDEMLDCEGIDLRLNTSAKDILEFLPEEGKVLYEGKPFEGRIIFTGAIDELFDCKYGRLPYRSLRFDFEHYKEKFYQSHGVVNYTVSEDYTRITEFKYLSGQLEEPETTIIKEYPMPYEGKDGEIPYYAINNPDNQALYGKYKDLVSKLPGFYLLGRLAEYKYYNIDAMVEQALQLCDQLLCEA